MREKSIRQRLLRTILGVAFSLAFVIGAVSASQMYGQRRSINDFNQKAVERLSSEVDDRLQEMNRQVARDISASFSERINQNFREMRENVEAVANMLGVLYSYGPDPSVQPDQMAGLMPGATWDGVLGEFSAIRDIREDVYKRQVHASRGICGRERRALLCGPHSGHGARGRTGACRES